MNPENKNESEVSGEHRDIPEILESLKELVVSMLSTFSLGFRFLFVTIPFAFYSAGSIPLIISTFVILLFLYHIDHIEKSTFSSMAGMILSSKNK
jgi:membrane-bound ClpP family serine protease